MGYFFVGFVFGALSVLMVMSIVYAWKDSMDGFFTTSRGKD